MVDPMRGPSVLFVDDEEELVAAVVGRLELRGISAVGATSGKAGLDLALARDVDVVVLDVKMQGMSGFEVLRALKRTPGGPAVVLLSGHGSCEDVEQPLRLGAFDYLHKPVDIEHLVEVIRAASGNGVRGPGNTMAGPGSHGAPHGATENNP